MKMLASASATAVLLLVTPGAAQSQSAQAASPQTPSVTDLTRALNGGPPFAAPSPVPAPAPAPEPVPAVSTPPATVANPAITPGPAPTTVPPAPAVARPAPAVAPAPDAPVATTPPAAPAPAYRPLDATARAALPFRLDLPEAFELGTGRPGPGFTIYSVRRDGTPFVMIYAGPASQFPIYDGQIAEVAGRASVVVTEADGRHALEHLFQRAAAPREIHVWVASLDPADRAVAERIAQSVDLR